MIPLLFKPLPGLILVTLRAGAIAAGVVGKDTLAAVIALVDVASKERRPAVLDVVKGALLLPGQTLAKLPAVRCTMKADDIGHLQHEDRWGVTGSS
jgi:hypothetical protein